MDVNMPWRPNPKKEMEWTWPRVQQEIRGTSNWKRTFGPVITEITCSNHFPLGTIRAHYLGVPKNPPLPRTWRLSEEWPSFYPRATHHSFLPQGTCRRKCRAQYNSHLHFNELPHLMSATLNVEWLAWIVKTPSKVFLDDQEVARQEADETSIPLNPTKIKIARGWRGMAIKGGREQQERGFRKVREEDSECSKMCKNTRAI